MDTVFWSFQKRKHSKFFFFRIEHAFDSFFECFVSNVFISNVFFLVSEILSNDVNHLNDYIVMVYRNDNGGGGGEEMES